MIRLIHTTILAVAIFSTLTMGQADELNPLDYPESKEISLGEVRVQVQPEQFMKFESPFTGLLHLKKKSGFYKKGTIWSEVAPERLALEKETFDIKMKLFEAKEKPATLLEIAETRIALENRQEELKRNLDMLGDILNEPELAELYLGNKGEKEKDSKKKVAELRLRISKQLEAMEAALKYIGTPDQQRLEIRIAEIELERTKQQLDQKERETRFKMPFSGELKFTTEIPDDLDQALELQASQPFAEISQYGRLECRIVISNPMIRQMPTHPLILIFPRHDSFGQFEATFKRKENRESFGKTETVYIFQFSEETAQAARTLIGGRTQANLVYRLNSPAHLIPKLDVVRAASDELSSQGWHAGIHAFLPEWRALVIGEHQIAVAKREKMKARERRHEDR